jgi:hypothetical protein
MSQYVNPLSETTAAFLSSFNAKCSDRGFGFLGGDPNELSVYHMKMVTKTCFAPGELSVHVATATSIVAKSSGSSSHCSSSRDSECSLL